MKLSKVLSILLLLGCSKSFGAGEVVEPGERERAWQDKAKTTSHPQGCLEAAGIAADVDDTPRPLRTTGTRMRARTTGMKRGKSTARMATGRAS